MASLLGLGFLIFFDDFADEEELFLFLDVARLTLEPLLALEPLLQSLDAWV